LVELAAVGHDGGEFRSAAREEAIMAGTKAPVVFIHGLWLHAASWAPWQERFREAGYEASAPGWPGDADTVEATRANPDGVANHGIDDVTDHYASFIDGLPSQPILIGHSFGA
jgi:pimeloyl-ACP methyl ester carboxylesterase